MKLCYKACTRCKKPKPFGKFGPRKDSNHGLTSRCKQCCNEARKLRYKAHPRIRQTVRNQNLKRWYGIDESRYNEILDSQDNKCAGCKKDQSEFDYALCVDHDHNCCPEKSCGNCIRGLLCKPCNWGEGHLLGNPNTYFSLLEHIGIDLDLALSQYKLSKLSE